MRRSIPVWTRLWVIGGILVFLGAGVPLLIILPVLPSTFLLALVSFASSTIGVILGYIAMASYVHVHRGEPPFDDPPSS